MTSPRGGRVFKGRAVLYLAAVLCTVSVFYLYQAYNQNYENARLLHHNCLAEQTSLSSQLQAVVEYKGRLEQSLTAEKQALSALRTHDQRERDSLTSRLGNLQDLFDTLTIECNKVEKSAQQEQALLHRYRESLSEVERNLNKKVKDLENENQLLRDKNQKLMYASNPQTSYSYPRVQTENKNISKQIEIAKGVFNLNVNTNSFNGQAPQVVAQVGQLKDRSENGPSLPNVGFLKQNLPSDSFNHSVPVSPPLKPESGNPNARPVLPDGFAPELFVHDNHKLLDKNAYQLNKGLPEKLVLKPPNRYQAKLGEEKVLDNLDTEKKVESALERLSPPLDDKFHNPDKINNNDHYAFQEINNNLPVEGRPKKHRANINDNADFNDVNISLDQAEPAMPNHFEQEDDENEDYDNNKLDFQAANRN